MKHSLLFPVVLLSALVGCAPEGPELAEVSGTVTLDGRPLPNADVIFIPTEAAKGTPSYGTTNAEGYYTLKFTRDKSGAMLGRHDVEIKTEKLTPAEIRERKAYGQGVPKYIPVPAKYAKRGALTAEVEAGDNEVNFNLESE